MMVSTRGKYALQFMIDLAENGKDGCVPLKVKSDLIRGIQGKEGGYRLTREPAAYRVGEILRLTEGDLAPVSCLEQGAPPCAKTAECRTRPLWNGLNAVINEYLDKVTIADLMQ